MLQNILISLGWQQKQADVYLALLELGTAKVSQIAKEANLNRVTCYDILESLQSDMIVTPIKINRQKHYTAISPEALLAKVESHTSALRQNLNKFKEVQGSSQYKQVKYFQGLKQCQLVLHNLLESQSDIYCFLDIADLLTSTPDFLSKQFAKARQQHNVFLHIIAPDTPEAHQVQSTDCSSNRKTKLINGASHLFPSSMYIMEDKLITVEFGESPNLVLIENANMAQTQLNIFKMLWGTL